MTALKRTENLWKGWDLYAGLACGVLAGLLGTSDAVREQGVTALLAEAATGVALMGVVLAALAIFAAFFDGYYRRVLEAAGGVARAMQPYVITAAVGGLCAVVGVLSAIAWPELGPTAAAIVLGISTWLCVWTIAGTVALVSITLFHAGARASLMRGVEDSETIRARRLVEQRQRAPAAPRPSRSKRTEE